MLRIMREQSQSVIIYLMFGILVFVFAVSFGPGSGSCGSPATDYAAQVNGDLIRRQEFAILLQQRIASLRSSGAYGGSPLSTEMIEALGIRRQVIDQLIETKLLTQEAERRGLTVSDDDLFEFLNLRYAVGDVDVETYRNWVNRNWRLSVARFESFMRGTIMADKMARILRENVSIGKVELKEKFMREHDRATVDRIRSSRVNALKLYHVVN